MDYCECNGKLIGVLGGLYCSKCHKPAKDTGIVFDCYVGGVKVNTGDTIKFKGKNEEPKKVIFKHGALGVNGKRGFTPLATYVYHGRKFEVINKLGE